MYPNTRFVLPVALAVAVSAAGLSACGEKPQRVMHEGGTAHDGDRLAVELRDRTRHQGEADRINY